MLMRALLVSYSSYLCKRFPIINDPSIFYWGKLSADLNCFFLYPSQTQTIHYSCIAGKIIVPVQKTKDSRVMKKPGKKAVSIHRCTPDSSTSMHSYSCIKKRRLQGKKRARKNSNVHTLCMHTHASINGHLNSSSKFLSV